MSEENKYYEIPNWIEEECQEDIEEYECAISKEFGFVTMSDGRKAQIKVLLELDEDEWE